MHTGKMHIRNQIHCSERSRDPAPTRLYPAAFWFLATFGILALIVCLAARVAAQDAPGLAAQDTSAVATQDALVSANDPEAQVLEKIHACLELGEEAVLLHDGVVCRDYRKGSDFLDAHDPDMPMNNEVNKACSNLQSISQISKPPVDWRILSGKAIKKIIENDTTKHIDRMGIRLIGAIFCDRVDLYGVDIPYSLVIDRSILQEGFLIRNAHIGGDFSFDNIVSLGDLTIARSQFDGSMFGNSVAVSGALEIFDSHFKGSILFRKLDKHNPASFQRPVIFDTITTTGEVSFRDASLKYLMIQFSKIEGILDLTNSASLCAYLIRKSTFGDLVVVNAGFPDITESACVYNRISSPNAKRFRISDTHILSSLCFRSFNWPPLGEGVVTFDSINVETTASIDLKAADKFTTLHPSIEIFGLKSNSLIFNFRAFDLKNNLTHNEYDIKLSGLTFENVYSFISNDTNRDLLCSYDPNFANPPDENKSFTNSKRKIDSAPIVAQVPMLEAPFALLRPPSVDEVVNFLDSNRLDTTQPFSAFVDVARRTGNDGDAKELRIHRATKELGLRWGRVFGQNNLSSDAAGQTLGVDAAPQQTIQPKQETEALAPYSVYASTEEATIHIANAVNQWGNKLLAIFGLVFGVLLSIIADHGYRPEKVIWFVALAVLFPYLYIWFFSHVIGFNSKDSTSIRPIGIMFLFDWLIPVYKIQQENYDIQTYYRRIPRLRDKNDEPANSGAETLKYWWFKIPVVEANDGEVRRTQVLLVVVKVVGLGLTIFLVAAINALVRTQ